MTNLHKVYHTFEIPKQIHVCVNLKWRISKPDDFHCLHDYHLLWNFIWLQIVVKEYTRRNVKKLLLYARDTLYIVLKLKEKPFLNVIQLAMNPKFYVLNLFICIFQQIRSSPRSLSKF